MRSALTIVLGLVLAGGLAIAGFHGRDGRGSTSAAVDDRTAHHQGAGPAPTTPAPGPGRETPPPAARPQPAGPLPSSIAGSKARIRFERQTYDFGTVPFGAVVRETFRFTSAGTEELQIAGVQPGCGCTAALASARALPPGAAGEIEVVFDSVKKPGHGDLYPVQLAVTVRTNDPTQREMGLDGTSRILLTGRVAVRYRPFPETGLYLPSFARGAALLPSGTVGLFPTKEGARVPEARILEVPHDLVLAKGPERTVRQGKEGFEMVVSVAADARPGPIQGRIRVATGDPEQPEVQIPVHGVVLASIQAMPPRVYFAGQEPRDGRVLNVQSAKEPFALLAIEGADPDIDVKLPPAGTPGRQLQIRLSPREPRRAMGGGVLRLLLASAETPVIDVPYFMRDPEAQRREMAESEAAKVSIVPFELRYGDVQTGEEREFPVTIRRTGGAPLDPVLDRVEPEGRFDVRVLPTTVGELYRVHVRLVGAEPGPFVGRVLVRPRPGQEPVAFWVEGRVIGRVLVEPAGAYLAGPRDRASAELRVRRSDGAPLAFEGVEDPSGLLEVVFEPAQDGRAHEVRVFPKPGAPQTARAELVLKTGVVYEERIRVAVVLRLEN